MPVRQYWLIALYLDTGLDISQMFCPETPDLALEFHKLQYLPLPPNLPANTSKSPLFVANSRRNPLRNDCCCV